MVKSEDDKKGRSIANCDGVGHFKCESCKWRRLKSERNDYK